MTNPVALVSGCSSGIGEATALAFARAGYRVYAGVRSPPAWQSLADSAAGMDLRPLPLDVTDQDQVRAAARTAIEESGGVDVLVNNAGYGLLGAIEDLPIDLLRCQFETNLFGHLALIREIVPSMRERRRGVVVNVSSLAGRVSVPLMGAYCASKFALEAATMALRLELRPWHVYACLVEPGPVRTRFDRAALEASRGILENPLSPYSGAYRLTQRYFAHPSYGAATPEQVARTILRVASARRPRLRYTVRLRDAVTAAFGHLAYTRLGEPTMMRIMGLDGIRLSPPGTDPGKALRRTRSSHRGPCR